MRVLVFLFCVGFLGCGVVVDVDFEGLSEILGVLAGAGGKKSGTHHQAINIPEELTNS
jgi:hypothetical protein